MNSVRVLVVDDQKIHTTVIRMILEKTGGYTVCEMTDPLMAVETAREFNPDVIILDVNMPGKNGQEVALGLRNETPLQEIPIIFLSGDYRSKAAVCRETSSGPSWFLPKPATGVQLLKAIQQAHLSTGLTRLASFAA
jgi:CheY-like chemotaxis protein